MIAHVDVSTGASGDKINGALMQICEQLGVLTRDELAAQFAEMLPDARVEFFDKADQGICGMGLHVHPVHAQVAACVDDESNAHVHTAVEHEHHHHHDHDHGHEHHHHDHEHDHDHEHEHHHHHDHEHDHEHHHDHEHDHGQDHSHSHSHEHRSWADIKEMICTWRDQQAITHGAAERALKAFEIVAHAEAAVHGVPLEEVHFHEVGAIDSIVDTVAASMMMDLLNIQQMYCTPVTVGFGTVDCAHGTLPVPAPATARICEGMPICAGPYEGEMTTPTGAALLKANVTHWHPYGAMVPAACGMGMGTRHIDGVANCLRIMVGDDASLLGGHMLRQHGCGASLTVENVALLQSNIDHISPEIAASCCEDLMEAGALDVWQQPITMKKGRLAFTLNVLVRPDRCDEFCLKISELTGTLGVRRAMVERTVAPRQSVVLQTSLGEVRYKVAEPLPAAQRPSWVRPEHDDVAAIARITGMPYAQVFEQLVQEWDELRG